MLAAFAGVALLATIDVAADIHEGTTLGHVIAEVGVILVGLVGVIVVASRLRVLLAAARAAQEEASALAGQLQAARADAARWKDEAKDLLSGLGVALDRQFDRWSLSPAEKEVSLLLLKGLSHKEVAEVRQVAEATARQQARSIYKKAGLSGRNDLAAFFLEDLLLPRDPEGAAPR